MPSRRSPAQIRGARGVLNGSIPELARAAGVSVSTVKRMEVGEPQPVSDEVREAVRGALEQARVCFLTCGDGGAGPKLGAR